MKFVKRTSAFIIALMLLASILVFESLALTRPTVKGNPINGQILPFYEVWLHWYDVPDEHHYTMTIRDLGQNGAVGDAGPLIYDRQYVAQNSTYFVVPTSKLERGHHYRWCVNSCDANGNRKIAATQYFAIEMGYPDSHFVLSTAGTDWNYPTNVLEYFIYAESSEYDSIINSAVQSWNGIANVSLVRTAYPSDGHYEVEIYDNPAAPDADTYGNTLTYPVDVKNPIIVDHSLVRLFDHTIYDAYINHPNDFVFINSYSQYLKPNAMHEIGHALLLAHSWVGTDITHTIPATGYNLVPLIMNGGPELGPALNVVDRDHLRLKWGA